MKTILVAVDFSDASKNAASYAAQLSLEIHATLILFHVYQYPIPTGDTPYPSEFYVNIVKDAETSMKILADKLTLQLNGRRTPQTELRDGGFIHQLNEFSKECSADLVVLGTNGMTAAGKFLFGSQALQAIRELEPPVITIPPDARYKDITRLGLITDLTHVAATLPLQPAIDIMNSLHAKLYIGHIAGSNDYNPNLAAESQMIKEMLGLINFELHQIQEEEFESGVMKFVDQYKLDLLIIVPYRHSFFRRLFHATHTELLLKDPFIPMLFLKAN